MRVEDALDRLLAQSGLVARKQGGNTFTIEPTGGSAQVTLPATVATASAQQESATGPVRGYIAQRSATCPPSDQPQRFTGSGNCAAN